MTPTHIALTVVVLGLLGWWKPRNGFCLLVLCGLAYLAFGWVPFE
jgi:hypothetical protein